jgi:hypothetical protein
MFSFLIEVPRFNVQSHLTRLACLRICSANVSSFVRFLFAAFCMVHRSHWARLAQPAT